MNNVVHTNSHNNQYSIRDLQVQYNTIKELSTEIKEQRQSGGLVRAANRRLFDHLLEYAIPTKRADDTKDKRYKKYKAIAKLFDKARLSSNDEGKIKNLYLVRKLIPRVRHRVGYKDRYIMVNSSNYKANKGEYNTKLKNRMKWLNKHWLPIGYKAKFRSDYCEVVKIPQTATSVMTKSASLLL